MNLMRHKYTIPIRHWIGFLVGDERSIDFSFPLLCDILLLCECNKNNQTTTEARNVRRIIQLGFGTHAHTFFCSQNNNESMCSHGNSRMKTEHCYWQHKYFMAQRDGQTNEREKETSQNNEHGTKFCCKCVCALCSHEYLYVYVLGRNFSADVLVRE